MISCTFGEQNYQFIEKHCTSLAIQICASHCSAETRCFKLVNTLSSSLIYPRKEVRMLDWLRFLNSMRSTLLAKSLIALVMRSKSIWAMISMRSWQARAQVREYWKVYPCRPILVFVSPLGSLIPRQSDMRLIVFKVLFDFVNDTICELIQLKP